MPKLASVRGTHALVMGASSGIGRALALRLASEGARLSLLARRRAPLEEVAGEVCAIAAEARVLVCDSPQPDRDAPPPGVVVVENLEPDQLIDLLAGAKVIARGGGDTIAQALANECRCVGTRTGGLDQPERLVPPVGP